MKFEKVYWIPIIFFILAIAISSIFLSHNRIIYEVGFVEQGVWNTLQGNFFYEINNGGNHFARHNSPILFLFLPIYYLFPNIIVFMILTNLFIAIGSIPVYLFAKKLFKSKLAGLTFMVSFLLFPSFLYSNIRSFHPIMLAVMFMSFAIYFMYEKKWNLFMLFSVLAMLTNEGVSLTLIFLGLFVFWKFKERIGLILVLVALGWFIISTSIIIPSFNSDNNYSMIEENYGTLGSTMGEVVRNIIINPVDSFKQGFVDLKLKYLRVIFEHNIFIAFLSPALLLVTIPVFAQNLFSASFYKYDVVAHYIYPIIPILFFASILGLKKFFTRIKVNKELVFIILILVALLNASYGLKPLWKDNCEVFGCNYESLDIIGDSSKENAIIVNSFIELIPNNASVLAQNHVYSKVSNRKETFLFSNGWSALNGEYFILDLEGILPVEDRDYFLNTQIPLSGYKVLEQEGSVYLFKK